ncbi:hypothetical protein PC121_g20621 [Phytophthora cactorum]|nr:hypothetical protein PC120_g21269 [Phytophthora cactorum]KAG3046510.1 hypothetical protein PC121_g20621 [Phytophthora cactorum]
MRMLECVHFDDNPTIIGATAGLLFGRYGASVMHYARTDSAAQLEAGSSGANLNLDFGSNTAPPPPPACDTYFDLLGAIQGLLTFVHTEWHEIFTHPLHRIREFVVANMNADPITRLSASSGRCTRSTITSVQLTRIEFKSIAWAMALQEIASASSMSTPHALTNTSASSSAARPTSRGNHVHRGDNERLSSLPSGIPASVRALIPRDTNGVEPCLRFFGGNMCFGGTKDKCTAGRKHTWPDELPVALVNFATKMFGRR